MNFLENITILDLHIPVVTVILVFLVLFVALLLVFILLTYYQIKFKSAQNDSWKTTALKKDADFRDFIQETDEEIALILRKYN